MKTNDVYPIRIRERAPMILREAGTLAQPAPAVDTEQELCTIFESFLSPELAKRAAHGREREDADLAQIFESIGMSPAMAALAAKGRAE